MKKIEKDSVDFSHEGMTLKVRVELFSTFDSKTTERSQIFLRPYLALLLTTKLSCLQKNNFGPTSQGVLQQKNLR